jgi:hypothetical protein
MRSRMTPKLAGISGRALCDTIERCGADGLAVGLPDVTAYPAGSGYTR